MWKSLFLCFLFMFVYICKCVCVCVFVWHCALFSQTTNQRKNQKYQTLNCKVYVNRSKYDVLSLLDLNCNFSNTFTKDPTFSQIYAVKMKDINFKNMAQILQREKARFDYILAIKATGWTGISASYFFCLVLCCLLLSTRAKPTYISLIKNKTYLICIVKS